MGAVLAIVFGAAYAGPAARTDVLIAETKASQSTRLDALRVGLLDAGYKEGQHITVELRSADGRYERLPLLAAELARANVDTIIAFGVKALVAEKGVTDSIPIVIPATSSDIVAMGLIQSLARPGGNITGSASFGSEVLVERLEILKDVLPRLTRAGIHANPANASLAPALKKIAVASAYLRVSFQLFPVPSPEHIDRVSDAIVKDRAEAIVVQDDSMFAASAKAIAQLANKHRIAVIGDKGLAGAGALIGYGRDEIDRYRRSAQFIGKILRTAKPDDLPIEQAMRFELVLNNTTARAMGITFPNALTMRADAVIQ